MLLPRTYTATDTERAAVNALLEKQNAVSASITRTEPNEQGPLRVETTEGAWVIHPDGKTEEEE